jgi:serine/threonine-protein kinase
MQIEASLRFAVTALEAGVIDAAQLAEACREWNEARESSLRDLVIAHANLKPEVVWRIEQLLLNAKPDTASDSPTRILSRSNTGAPAPNPAEAPDPATSEERYTRLHIHASGGMGQIWLARDGQLNRQVALKELRAEVAGDVPLTQRFVQEAQITGQLEHPGIVPVYDLGWNPRTHEPFYTMRFVRGRTMVDASVAYHERRLKDQADPLDFVALLNAFVAVCNTIAYAHSRRILHRDLKGENVLLGDFGEVVVLDWGLAKALDVTEYALKMHRALTGSEGTIAGSIIGTPGYMAPEQADGRLDLIDERTDIYGLGAILYEILTGQPPAGGDTATEAIEQALRGELVRPSKVWEEVPPALEAVCLRALAREQRHRYQTATELGQAVQRWQDDQRRAAESALQGQTEVLQSILASMGEGVIVSDADAKILHINPAAERIVGNCPVGTQLQLAPGVEMFLPDQITPCPREAMPLMRLRRGEDVDDVEYFIRLPNRPDGLWASASARFLKDSKGDVRGGLVVWRDISERKRAEEELRRSRERFDLAVQGSQDGLWDWDLDTNVIYYSPRWKSIIGYEDHEIAPALDEWSNRLHPEEKERVLAANYAHINGATPFYSYEYRLRHKDGSYRWILARGVALRDAKGRAYRMAGSHVDVTDRREAEQAMKESEARHNAVMTALPIGVIVLGADGQLLASNPSAERLLGRSIEQMKNGSKLDLSEILLGPDGAPLAAELVPAAISLRTGQPVQQAVVGVSLPGGAVRWLSVNTQALFRPHDTEPYAVVMSLADVSEFKAMEKALRQERVREVTPLERQNP